VSDIKSSGEDSSQQDSLHGSMDEIVNFNGIDDDDEFWKQAIEDLQQYEEKRTSPSKRQREFLLNDSPSKSLKTEVVQKKQS